ncbi:MAG: efflux RND transporter periplasmic adaptor subunit, partial [Sinobacteraceae bacterium]|nr:efflux RND transporter periplasmic adaptor subunit [Nevskiaceae bacterium]
MRKQILVVTIGLIVVFGGIFGGKLYAHHRATAAAANRGHPPTAVATAVAHRASWDRQIKVVGHLTAVKGTEITAQIAGNVTKVAFHSGQQVKRGQLLVRLDDSAQLAVLHTDEAKLKLARSSLARSRTLYAKHAASKQQLQTDQADYGMAKAAVEGDRAALKKLHITAPFSGVVGIRQVSLGQYVSPGTSVVSLQNWNSLFLNFSLPQKELSQLQPGNAVTFTVSAYPGKSFTGRVTAIGSGVDPATRNVHLQATLANEDGLLRPGLFGHVTLSFGKPLHGVVVPSTAITYSTFGDRVYVVRH